MHSVCAFDCVCVCVCARGLVQMCAGGYMHFSVCVCVCVCVIIRTDPRQGLATAVAALSHFLCVCVW